MFFSALVWYLDQHPERTDKLLAFDRKSPSDESNLLPRRAAASTEDTR
jgi:hypothetical protein